MIIPIRCFTCGSVIADKYDWYVAEVEKLKLQQKVEEKKEGKLEGLKHFEAIHTGPILDKLGLERYCCRRHLISQVDMMDTI
jgi:DNA-directed RNA polymerase subunit N (RpoN/RPB10)